MFQLSIVIFPTEVNASIYLNVSEHPLSPVAAYDQLDREQLRTEQVSVSCETDLAGLRFLQECAAGQDLLPLAHKSMTALMGFVLKQSESYCQISAAPGFTLLEITRLVPLQCIPGETTSHNAVIEVL